MKIIVIADLHYGERETPVQKRLETCKALNKLDLLLNKLETTIKPDLVIFLGDQIYRDTEENNKKNMDEFNKVLRKYNLKYDFILGNHELVFNEEELFNHYKMKEFYFEKIIEGNQLLFLDTIEGNCDKYFPKVAPKEVDWLKEKLSHSKDYNQIFIFSHMPIYKFNITKYPWFKPFENRLYVENYKEILEILKSTNKYIYSIFGHVHQNDEDEDKNIKFISIAPFSKFEEKEKGLEGHYLEIEINDKVKFTRKTL